MINTPLRIHEILEYSKISAPEFAKKCGLNKSTIYNYLNGKSISSRNLKKILDSFPEISETWLFSGRGPMFAPKKLKDLDLHLNFYSAMRIIEYTYNSMATIESEIREMKKSLFDFIEKFKEYHKLPVSKDLDKK